MKQLFSKFSILFLILFHCVLLKLDAQERDVLSEPGNTANKMDFNTNGSPFGFGLKVGGNSSNFSGLPDRTERQLGFSAGVYASYKLNARVEIQVEVLYMQQGGTYLSNDSMPLANSVKSTNNITLHNIEIPLLLKYSLPIGKSDIKPQFLIGPALGINFQATDYVVSNIVFNSGREAIANYPELVNSEYANYQWGAYFGFSQTFKVSSYYMTVDLRYRLGINPVIDLANFYNPGQNLVTSRTNTLSLNFAFGF